MVSGKGINTVHIDGKVIHITDLDSPTLCEQWSKRQRELNDLYEINTKANSGWKGLVLKLLGITLPDKKGGFLGGINSKN
ncbi:MAG: hypothetical protein JKX76_03765 [Colwellia sp.]|nr:hypothetical protein [Colwellia sp.]